MSPARVAFWRWGRDPHVLTWRVQSYVSIRDDIVHRLAAPGRVQLIRGDAGAGKTTLAGEVARELDAQGFTVVPVVGILELREVPLGAMAPVLALASAVSDLPAAERLQLLLSTVASPPAGVRYLLAVDDGPLLDELSASAIYQCVRLYGLRCVMTARTGQSLVGPLARLLDEGFVDAVDLPGITDEQAIRAVREAFGGAVAPRSLGRLVRLAAGNPLFLRELTFAAHRADAVRTTSRGLEIDVRSLPTHLHSGISERFSGLTDGDRELVEMLAVAAPLPGDALGREAVERLKAGLLVAETGTGVGLAHPLFAEVVLAALPEGIAEKRRREAARLLDAEPPTLETRYRVGCLRLGTGRTRRIPPISRGAAQHADWLGDRAMSLRLADAAVAREATVHSLAIQGFALSQLRRWDDADRAFARMSEVAGSDDDRVFAAVAQGAHWAFYRSDPAAAVALGREVLATLTEARLRGELQTHLATWQIFAGEPLGPEATAALDAGATTVHTAVVAALAAIFVGDITGATEAIRLGTPLVDTDRSLAPRAREVFEFSQIFLSMYAGEMDRARALATKRATDQFSDLSATFAYSLAMIESYSGDAERCLEAALAALDGLQWLDMASLRMPTHALLASAYARLGDAPAAEAQLELIDDVMRSNGNVVAQSAEARAWMLAMAGRRDDAAELAAAAAADLAERGLWGIAASTAHVAVRVGRPSPVVSLLHSAAEHSPGPLLAAMDAHADAAARNDAEALVAAAHALAATGQFGAAADAADEAAEGFASRGRAEAERKARRAAADYAARSSGFRLRGTEDLVPQLTARERVVAEAAAGRETSKEIAERLGVSTRTVESPPRETSTASSGSAVAPSCERSSRRDRGRVESSVREQIG